MKTEQQALRTSLVAILVLSALGIGFGVVSGSSAIIFDGVFSLMDAVMSVVSIVVAGLIARSTANELSQRVQRRFTMGFWHFEPVVLAVNALLMMSVATYALIQSILSILSGGREIEFGPAVAYAGIVLVLTSTVGLPEHRANRRIDSALVAVDVKGWLMAGGVTAALLIAFLIGLIIQGTHLDWLLPYVDPVVLALVAAVLIPVPFGTLRKAVAELALITPDEVMESAERLAAATVEDEGFSTYRVSAAKTGRATQIDVVFLVPEGLPPRQLEDWDRIRAELGASLGHDDPNNWITISFTTRPYAFSE